MPTPVKISTVNFPFPMGYIIPGASYATVSVPLTQNFLPDQLAFSSIAIQADPDNSADYIYICSDARAPQSNGSNVIAKLAPGAWLPYSREWGNIFNLNSLFIGATNSTDHAIVSVMQV